MEMKNKIHFELITTHSKVLIKNYCLLNYENRKTIQREYKEKLKILKKSSELYFSYKTEEEVIDLHNFIKDYAAEQNLNISVSKKIQDLIKQLKIKKDKRKQNLILIKKIKSRTKDNFIENNIKKISSIIEPLINFKPREYQYKSIYHHILLDSACDFSVPGSGKSLIALAVFLYLKSLKKVNKIFIISPIGSFISWEDEYKKIVKTADQNKIIRLRTFSDNTHHLFKTKTAEMYLINYEKLNSFKFKELLKNTLDNENSFFIVLDEVHRIKNPLAKRSEATETIVNLSKYILLLTGTPMPQSFADLKIYFDIIKKKYEKNLLPSFKQLKSSKNENWIQKKIEKIKPYYYRITKNELGLKKPLINLWTDFKLDENQHRIYQTLEQKIFQDLSQETNYKVARKMFRGRIFRMMQIVVDPRMILLSKKKTKPNKDEKYNEIKQKDKWYKKLENDNSDIREYSQKIWEKIWNYKKIPERYCFCLKKINQLFEKKKIKKIIIWSSWIFVIKELKKIFEKKYKTEIIYGKVEISEREKFIHDFQKKDGEIQILICNPSSVSESISLHQECDDAVYFDITWNAIYYLQSKDRIHRLGKFPEDRQVNYYLILYKQSIDEKIWKNIFKKEKRMIENLENSELEKNTIEEETELIDDLFYNFWKENKK